MKEFVGKVGACCATLPSIPEEAKATEFILLVQVVSNRMMKSVLVAVARMKPIPKYKVSIRRTKKFMVRALNASSGFYKTLM